jgi:hypothetical protein
MGKRVKILCWKCEQLEFQTYINLNASRLCRNCSGVTETHDGNKARRKPLEELTLSDQIARQTQDEERKAQDEALRRELANHRANERLEAEKAELAKAVEMKNYVDAFEARLAKVANPAAMCQCCMAGANTSKGEHHEELIDPDTSESRYFCRLCVYTISRCGSCAIHRTTPFPKIAATVPALKIRDIPRDVLYPLTYEFFE